MAHDPQSRMHAVVDLVAASPLPMLLVWGNARTATLNDACLRLARRIQDDPAASGWPELLDAARPAVEACFLSREAPSIDRHFPLAASEPSHWCTLSFGTVDGAGGEAAGVLCFVVETTALARAWQRLAEVEQQARAHANELSIVYARSQEILFHLSCEDGGQFRYRSVNPAFLAATGLAEQEVVGKLVQEVIPEPSASRQLAHFRQAHETGRMVRYEESAEFPGGPRIGRVSVAPVRGAGGACTDLIGTVHDISDLKRAEDRLRAANEELKGALAEQGRLAERLRIGEERLAFALESSGEGVWDWDIANEKMQYSVRWKQIVGLAGDVADDFNLWWERMHPDDVPHAIDGLRACINGTRSLCVDDHRLWHQSGHWIWVHARGSVVARDANGQALRMVGTIADITATTELRHDLERSRDLLSKLTQQVPGVLFELVRHPDGRVTCPFVSAMAAQTFGRSPVEIEADFKCVLRRVQRHDRARLRRSMQHSADGLSPWRAEFRVVLPREGECWRELNAKPTRARDGSVVWHGFASDISERKRAEQTIRQFNEKLERRANYDPLTGLPNRVLFRDRLEQEMKHAAGSPHGMALLFIDLDRFKEVNDLLGHNAGDELLAQAARRIEGCLGPGDTVARLGGDEFTVILTGAGELAHVEQAAQEIVEVLRAPFKLGIEQVNISGSIGITLYPGDAATPEELMRNADHAMYRSKAAGRNQLTFFEPTMQHAAVRRLKLSNELRSALPEKQLELRFQPILDAASGAVVKAEALLRWRRHGHGLALPGDFVAIAEETGMIHEIGNWVFREAAAWSQRWSALLGRPFQISINKSPVQFQQHIHTMNWIDYLDRRGMPHSSIAVEITEGVLLNLTDSAFEKLHELQAGGVEVSIDDFGTGYSSMSYLKRLDIDYLKIDRSFVAEMLHDPTTQTITETIIVMAHKLGLKVIAEGVESIDQRDWLAERHCDYLQGFLFGQPVTADGFEGLLSRQPFFGAARGAAAPAPRH